MQQLFFASYKNVHATVSTHLNTVYIFNSKTLQSEYELLTNILTIFFWIIKYLIFPHIEIKNHDKENDTIVEPFA